jgi:D-serine deaminase-like pyridoxal phosphate-dependent protein
MANAVRGSGLALRPHAKSHKCPDIAKAQVARGAVGICCQKVDEAAAFVAAGIADVLVTNEIVAPSKIDRLAALAQSRRSACWSTMRASCRICRPRRSTAAARSTSTSRSTSVPVVAVVAPGEPAVAIARAANEAKGLRFRGIHAYHGAAQHLRTPAERRDAIERASAAAGRTKRMIESAGIAARS